MRITVVAVGKLKEKFYEQAVAEYAKRLSRFVSLSIRELPDGRNIEEEAEVILRASSGQIEIAPNSGWSPTKMADMQFNQVFSVTYAPAGGEASPVNIDDNVILKGGSTDNPAGDMLLWVNWMDVTFGEVDLKHGDNVFTFTVISNLTHASSPNGPGGSCAANVDRLEVRFLDEADA